MPPQFAPAVTGPTLDRILDETYSIWGEGLTRHAYGRWNEAQMATPWGRRHLRRAALLDDGIPVVSAKTYALEARIEDRVVPVLGIGAVFTPPEHRRRGLAGALIYRLWAAAAPDGVRLALLFSEIGASFYERLGFAVVPRTEVMLDVRPFRRGPPAAMVRTADARDLDAIAALGAGSTDRASFQLVRSSEFASFMLARKRLLAGLGPMGARQVEVLVTEEAYRPVAYIVVSYAASGAVLEACGDRDPAGARVGAMLQTLVARSPAEPRLRLRAALPPGFTPPQVTVTPAGPAGEIMMVRGIGGAMTPEIDPARVAYWPLDTF